MQENRKRIQRATASCLLVGATFLAGCGGDGASSNVPPASTPVTPVTPETPETPTNPGPVAFTIGGTLTGLASGATVVLQNNSVDALTLSSSGTFRFATPVSGSYAVTVGTQPAGQTCTVSHASGTATASVTDVAVDCVNDAAPQAQVASFVGSSTPGFADGTGAAARFYWPEGMAFDASGNLYLADRGNHAIRKITPAGVVSTIAGSTTQGSADGIGVAASFRFPSDVAVDAGGNVFVVDHGNHKIRRIDGATGAVTTLAGSNAFGTADGTGAAARFTNPHGIAIDAGGNLYVGDFDNNMIRKVTPGGVVTTLAGAPTIGDADGTGATARFSSPTELAVDSNGNIFVADAGNNRIRKITPAGVVTTVAGSTHGWADGVGSAAQFNAPFGIAIDAEDNVYIADRNNNRIRKMTPGGVVTTIAGSGVAGEDNGSGSTATFNSPWALVVDTANNLYVTALNSPSIRKIVLP